MGNRLAVNIDVDLFALGGIAGTCAAAQPALDPPPFVIIGSGAAGIKIISHLKTIDVKLTHIVPYPVKVFNQLLKFCHKPASLII